MLLELIEDKMIPVVDIFAGPGGLSEGFSSVLDRRGHSAFDVVLSVEMERYAFETLYLRTFFRQFPLRAPADYYRCLRGEITLGDLYGRHPREAERARARTWCAELGSDAVPIHKLNSRLNSAIRGDEVWVLLGGPPCQAYSIAGRSRNRGNPGYDPRKDLRQRLYVEYLQVMANGWPAAFIMENVKGLLSATIRNERMFARILEDLRDPATALLREGRTVRRGRKHQYRIYSLVKRQLFEDGSLQGAVIPAERYGVPQSRHRVILLGLRDDLGAIVPETLRPSPEVSTCSVIRGVPPVRSGLSRRQDTPEAWLASLQSQMNSRWANEGTRRIAGDKLCHHVRRTLADLLPPLLGRGDEFLDAESTSSYAPEWFLDRRIGGICNHSTRSHMDKDLYRYLYAACYGQVFGHSPCLHDFPTDLLPNHMSVAAALSEGSNFSDRFRVQLADRPSTTVMSHIHKDGHYYIHFDPMQCRSLTVREAARLQTFPDNYFFCGPRSAQYIQVGNAVPPLLARQIGEVVLDALEKAGVAD